MDEVEYLGVTGTIFSYNLYSYCEGNPVIYGDDDGNAKELLVNQSVSNAFCRSGGNGTYDSVAIYVPKTVVNSVSCRAELILVPHIVKIAEIIKITISNEIEKIEDIKKAQIDIILFNKSSSKTNPPKIFRRSCDGSYSYGQLYLEGVAESVLGYAQGIIGNVALDNSFGLDAFNSGFTNSGFVGGYYGELERRMLEDIIGAKDLIY